MPAAHLVEYHPRGPSLAVGHIIEALANAFRSVRPGRHVEEPLISFGVLDNSRGLSLDREYYRSLALLQLLHEVPRSSPERRERLDILGDVEHRSHIIRAPF